MMDSNVLVSWKEIARYFGSGVRTIQRWEHDHGLPVHRPAGHLHGTVLAMKAELDEWASRCPTRMRQDSRMPAADGTVTESTQNLLQ